VEQTTFDELRELSLPITSSDLVGCLRSYLAPVPLDFNCPACGQPLEKQTSLYGAPRVLILHLVRFRNDGSKREDPVAVPELLTLDSDMRGGEAAVEYRLLAMSSPRGDGTKRGHYVAAVREGSRWWLCDDKRITPRAVMQVLQLESHVLFYECQTP
jgi:ubiquitin C-terminal hydrolase